MKLRPTLLCLALCAGLAACNDDAARAASEPAPATQDTPAQTTTSPAEPADAVVSDAPPPSANREPDVIFVPTPQPVVDRMLELAEIKPGDVLYDLGSGDGRIPVTAAKKYGIKAVGIDINPERIAEANENAKKEGVTDKVTFQEADLFTTDISQANVVTLYLLQSLNVKLRPKLLAELKPGTKIISHAFDMADEWAPEKTETVGTNTIYVWTVPERKP